ncbi:hypothetical protein B9Z55_015590 [Caenorhabditis nigoni]|uniref:HMG box domain-containing protein n=2 Tax=Caenorhabditis nigoni TaxID=1611254 RepID=A0A2G5UBF8_9PELO|nr:hypothetical protein B9Z55_015590 [Caenorhabditis nigoni]
MVSNDMDLMTNFEEEDLEDLRVTLIIDLLLSGGSGPKFVHDFFAMQGTLLNITPIENAAYLESLNQNMETEEQEPVDNTADKELENSVDVQEEPNNNFSSLEKLEILVRRFDNTADKELEDLVATDKQKEQNNHSSSAEEDLPVIKISRKARRTLKKSSKIKENRIKKPLNAFMCFVNENRSKLWDSLKKERISFSGINKILGQKYQELSSEERKKYFDMAKKEHEEHKEKYPEWTARQNYTLHGRKRKRKLKDKEDIVKCRGQFGIENKNAWCRQCISKKKCIYQESIVKTCPLDPSVEI